MESVLRAIDAHVEIVLSAEAALASMTGIRRPGLLLLDVRLPGIETSQLLAKVRSDPGGERLPIVLISEAVTPEWADRLQEGVIDDLLLTSSEPAYWRLRIEALLSHQNAARDVETLRATLALHDQIDTLTGVYNRATLLAMLFRETDRVQRMNTSLCMILFDIDDFGHWNSRLGADACDDLLIQVVGRVTRLLRSYDVLGRTGKDEFAIGLPGCSPINAVLLAERVRVDVFSAPFHVGNGAIRLSACFGIASSQGRSPVVVLREAEQAILLAKQTGPETIQSASDCPESVHPPVAFLSPTSGDNLLAW
jgi:diguanylate cyclase (GGDEF)-like protein